MYILDNVYEMPKNKTQSDTHACREPRMCVNTRILTAKYSLARLALFGTDASNFFSAAQRVKFDGGGSVLEEIMFPHSPERGTKRNGDCISISDMPKFFPIFIKYFIPYFFS